MHSDFWFLNTFSFQLVLFFLGSSLSHCLLSVHFCISLCWSATRKMIPFNRGLWVVVFESFTWKQSLFSNALHINSIKHIVFPIYSTRLLIFIKVNFSFNFMHEVPSSATFNFKRKGLVSSADVSELEWIPSKLLRAKTGKKKGFRHPFSFSSRLHVSYNCFKRWVTYSFFLPPCKIVH